MGLKSLSPAEFGQAHRKLFEGIVGPLAQGVGARSLSTKLHFEASAKQRDPDVALIFDNIKEIEETNKGALPLSKAYAADESLANEAASQAAKATGGVLTPESARFLPQAYRADYERITGCKIDPKAGTATAGVSIKQSGSNVDINIDFQKALAGASAKDVVLALTDHVIISASRLDPPLARPDLPPYWLVVSPREGKLDSDTWIQRGNGLSGFSSADSGSLLRAGTEKIGLIKGTGTNKPFLTLNVTLDAVNDYGTAVKEPSAQTKAAREAWGKLFKEADGAFDLDKGIKSGALTKLSLDELRALPGAKTLLSAIRENSGSSITKLYKNDLLTIVRDDATKTVGVLRQVEEESEQYLSVIDLGKKRWVGTWSVADDGTRDWSER